MSPSATVAPAAPLTVITGELVTGKTRFLAERALATIERTARERTGQVLITGAHRASVDGLFERIKQIATPAQRALLADHPPVVETLESLAFRMVRERAVAGGLAPDLELLLGHEIEDVFERATEPLFSADWESFLGPDIDPEISGLRAPDRFATAVLRLIVKLRDAGIDPDGFSARALRGATTFYGTPPNFTEPGLLFATKAEHRDSLLVDGRELERQRRREIDLAKIVAKLYRSYLESLIEHGCIGPGDAVIEATRLLGEVPDLARAYRGKFSTTFIDDAHDLRAGEFRFLQALFGEKLLGVTAAGSKSVAFRTFTGARADLIFDAAATTADLGSQSDVPESIAALARVLADTASTTAIPTGSAIRLTREPDMASETATVAERIATLIEGGVAPERIAVLHASARRLRVFEDALVDRDIAVSVHGDIDILGTHDAADALAVLWTAVDPFHHAWLLRALQLPIVGLADASLASLCAEPESPQTALFDLPDEASADRRGSRRWDRADRRRWDRRRNVRLATNVLGGLRDRSLTDEARERVRVFRERRAAWSLAARDYGPAAARAIVENAGVLAQRPGESPARVARRRAIVDATLALLDRHVARYPDATLEAALVALERLATSERGPHIDAGEGVFVGAIDAVGPRRFSHIFIVDLRAGSFPAYYVPDAFLFSTKVGIVPKDAAGDAHVARTAKFTWYVHSARLRDTYAREHRRLLAYAVTRADEAVTFSASGKATRGVAAPELLEDIRRVVRLT